MYLAALLDAYSRKCVGWNLSKGIDTHLALGALEQALATHEVRPGLIHHSDRGGREVEPGSLPDLAAKLEQVESVYSSEIAGYWGD
jgi:transposase InsO family protein